MDPTPSPHPRMRPVETFPVQEEGSPAYCLRDPSGESEEVLFLSEAAIWIVARLDGTRDAGDIQSEICRASGRIVPRETICGLIDRLDEAGFLDSPRFRQRIADERRAFLDSPRRRAAHAGSSYDSDPEKLGPWIDRLVRRDEPAPQPTPARALLSPHIDPRRGSTVYGSAYRSILESPAERFLILGISHGGGSIPFATISKDFETPFGDCRVDRDFIARIGKGLPFDPGSEPILHRREHSIEFQLLFLRRLIDRWDTKRIVPILCCFPWAPEDRTEALPYPPDWIDSFTGRLAEQIDRSTLVIAGVDFSHVGRRFGDGEDGTARREETERADRAMMERIAGGKADAFRSGIDRERDARRICGYPAILTLLSALPGMSGRILDYGQAGEPATGSLVSFGAMAFS